MELESHYENTAGTALLNEVYPLKGSIDQAAAAKNYFDMGVPSTASQAIIYSRLTAHACPL